MCVGALRSPTNKKAEQEHPSPWPVWFCILAVGVFFLGWLLVSTDIVEQNKNTRMARKNLDEYSLIVSRLDKGGVDSIRKRIRIYDKGLSSTSPGDPFRPVSLGEPQAYADFLREVDQSIMGYLVIPRVGLLQPVYYGPPDEVLERGVGHLAATAIPSDLSGIHTILFGHSGQDGNLVFDNLDRLAEGDEFSVRILDRTYIYKVSHIDVIAPDRLDALEAGYGKNQVTLMTCTPKGINSSRLMVTGDLTSVTGEEPDTQTKGSAWLLFVTGVPLLAALAGLVAVRRRMGRLKKKIMSMDAKEGE